MRGKSILHDTTRAIDMMPNRLASYQEFEGINCNLGSTFSPTASPQVGRLEEIKATESSISRHDSLEREQVSTQPQQ